MSFKRAVRKAVPPSVMTGQSVARVVSAQAVSGLPGRKLKVIGVTGTDGKSTTCYLIAALLRAGGLNTALLSTISVDLADGQGMRPSPKHMTTASNWQLARFIKKIKQNRAEWLVMEVSSHALDQRRVWGIPFSVAVMTNLSHEHLDYHGTMEHYAAAKARLFKLTSSNHKGLRVGIVNADDKYASLFTESSANPVTYGLKHGDWRATGVKMTSNGLEFTAKRSEQQLKIQSQLSGEFNVYNLLAAIAAAEAVGVSLVTIEKAIPQIAPPAGRMARLNLKTPFDVFIDYAVTPNSLEQALAAAKQIAKPGRVILVFGATGDRDKAKRPIMGEVAARAADRIFLTDDETHHEDPAAIRQAVYAGIEAADGTNKTEVVGDRRQAIEQALKTAKKGDVILISGLGHQTSRNMGGHDEPWSDAEVVKQVLKS